MNVITTNEFLREIVLYHRVFARCEIIRTTHKYPFGQIDLFASFGVLNQNRKFLFAYYS